VTAADALELGTLVALGADARVAVVACSTPLPLGLDATRVEPLDAERSTGPPGEPDVVVTTAAAPLPDARLRALVGGGATIVVVLGPRSAPSVRVASAARRWRRALRGAGATAVDDYALVDAALVDLSGRAPALACLRSLHVPLTRRAVVRGRLARALAALGGQRLAFTEIVVVARRAA
jgi:hypothetical protein